MEGTLVMDVFDGSTKDQIWQGIVTSTINENPDKREQTIPAKIASLMRKFPVQTR
jgi:ribosome recycling factor